MEVTVAIIVIVVPTIKTAPESTNGSSVFSGVSGLLSTSGGIVILLAEPVRELVQDDFVLAVTGLVLLGLDRKAVVGGLLLGLLVVVVVVVIVVVVVVVVMAAAAVVVVVVVVVVLPAVTPLLVVILLHLKALPELMSMSPSHRNRMFLCPTAS